MADEKLDYQKMTQVALRGVIRAALEVAAKDGLTGDHHFFIAFSTGAPGVSISQRLRERYPEEMTIVLQHQFWGLEVSADRFSIKLSFDNIPETLVVPYSAVKGFLDPSVQFGLQFDVGAAPVGDPAAVVGPLDAATPQTSDEGETADAGTDAEAPPIDSEASNEDAPAAAQVVSLDAFRKK